jgi:hypothetical protein
MWDLIVMIYVVVAIVVFVVWLIAHRLVVVD